jgi:hypothetical protein
MVQFFLLALILPMVQASTAPEEKVVVDCPGLRCAACQLGVLQGSGGFPGVRSVEFDRAHSRLTITVDPGFDRHHELLLAVQRVADPIEMFRATLVEPRQVFLYLDRHLREVDGDALCGGIRRLPGVKSVFRDERDVLSIAMSANSNRADILKCARGLGYDAELFETRYAANVESRISEESHHAIGLLLLLMSGLLIFERAVGGSPLLSRRILPGMWFLAGTTVLLFSDLDGWPFVRSLGDSLQDKMILQHKILGLAMVCLGVAEARCDRSSPWRVGATTLFLAIGIFSGIMLQFHFPNMVDPGHLQAWRWVNRQHLLAAVVGGAALLSRAASDYRWIRSPAFAYAWPIFLGLEGVLLCIFLEPVW